MALAISVQYFVNSRARLRVKHVFRSATGGYHHSFAATVSLMVFCAENTETPITPVQGVFMY